MAYGTAEQRGHALGELGANLLIGAVLPEVPLAAVGGAIEDIAGTLARTGADEALGRALSQSLRESEVLRPKMAAVDAAVQGVAESARIIRIRTPYGEAAQEMTRELLRRETRVSGGDNVVPSGYENQKPNWWGRPVLVFGTSQ